VATISRDRRRAAAGAGPDTAAAPGPLAAPTRSPRTLAQYDALVAMVKAVEAMTREFAELLKAEDLSPSQYNVLRILRGAGEPGLSCGDVGDRLIRHDPDITRLVDRLERRKLVARTRDARDRRVVRTRITDEGRAVIARLDGPVDVLHERQLGHMSQARLRDLRDLASATLERA
jgi:DNA-binding MarR family transcriptional regulator